MKLSKIAALFMVPVLALCLVACSAPGGNASESASSDPKIAELTAQKPTNADEAAELYVNMAVVSNYLSMNYSLFSYSFKQYTGSNFVNYLRDIRMKEAKRLLAGPDMRIAELSQAVGYENEKHFMKLFKSSCGVSPSEYRRNMGLTG